VNPNLDPDTPTGFMLLLTAVVSLAIVLVGVLALVAAWLL
jgi:hypothetical protein